MDAALQALLGSQQGGEAHGHALLPSLGSGIDSICPIGQLTLDEWLKKILPFLLVANFPGGTIFKLFIKKLLDALKSGEIGVGGGESMGHGAVSPGGGGDHGHGSGAPGLGGDH